MFGFLRRKPVDPPTARQLNYASKLGITITSKMSKAQVSQAIAEAEKKSPQLKRQRENINEKRAAKVEAAWAEECGPELIAAEEKWSQFADDVRFMLAVYDRGRATIVDVLEVNDAIIDGGRKKKLKLSVMAPKRVKDRYIGEYLEWEREFELPLEKLRYYEPLHEGFHADGTEAYQRIVAHGLKIAKKLDS